MKKLFFYLFFLFIFNVEIFCNNMLIGIIDTQYIFENAIQIKQIQKNIEDEFKDRQLFLLEKQRELKEKHELYLKNKDLLFDKDRILQEREITKIQHECQRMMQELEVDIRNKERDELILFNKLLNNVIIEVCDREGINIAIPNQMILFFNDKLNITLLILEELKKYYNLY